MGNGVAIRDGRLGGREMEGEVRKLKGGGKEKVLFVVQVVVAVCICQNIECLTG